MSDNGKPRRGPGRAIAIALSACALAVMMVGIGAGAASAAPSDNVDPIGTIENGFGTLIKNDMVPPAFLGGMPLSPAPSPIG